MTIIRDAEAPRFELPGVRFTGLDGPEVHAGDAVVVPAGSPIQLVNPTDATAEAFVAIRAGFAAVAADGTAISPPWAQ